MSDAKKCDRCGMFFELYKKPIILSKKGIWDTVDLCPNCGAELERWLWQYKEGANGCKGTDSDSGEK